MRNLKIEDQKLMLEDGRLEIGGMEIKYVGDGFLAVFFYGMQDPEKATRNLKIEDGSRKIGDGSLEKWRLRIWVMGSWKFFYGIQ
jgi:hypothetical protein